MHVQSLNFKYFWMVFIGLLLWCAPAPCPAEPASPADPLTIESREVTDGSAEDRQSVSLADVDESRSLTADRLYGLAGFWLLIILAICLIRYQIRDDEKLYHEGYYDKDIE